MRARTNVINKLDEALAKLDEYRKLDIFDRAEKYQEYAQIISDAGLEVFLLNCQDSVYNTIKTKGNILEFKL